MDVHKKRIKRVLLSLILFAAWICVSGFSSDTERVFDYDELYSEEEVQELEELFYKTASECKTDLVLVTIQNSDLKGRTMQEYADDYYDYNGFGYGDEYTGFLLLINMEDRELYISNAGEAPKYFTDGMIDEMVSSIGSRLADGEYFEAAEWFASYVEDNMWEEHGVSGMLHRWPVQLVLAAIISAVVVWALSLKQKTRMTAGSRTYLKDNQVNIISQSDNYVRTTTVSHKIESSSSSSGGSTHMGSSGRSHGGGGGKF